MNLNQVQQAFPVDLARRLEALQRDSGDSSLLELVHAFRGMLVRVPGQLARGASAGTPATPLTKPEIEEFRDRLSTRLMESFRVTASSSAFSLLYELNRKLFLTVISARLRKFYFSLDPQDILQEVFFNIYRYPHKFKADKDHAFRNWASMIIRNTVYKSTKDKDREITHELQDTEIDGRADGIRLTPLADAIREESRVFCSRTWVLILNLYFAAYQELSEREMKALRMVEVDGHAYKVAAAALGIRLENLKMVIFRARKKILRRLARCMHASEKLTTCLLSAADRSRDESACNNTSSSGRIADAAASFRTSRSPRTSRPALGRRSLDVRPLVSDPHVELDGPHTSASQSPS